MKIPDLPPPMPLLMNRFTSKDGAELFKRISGGLDPAPDGRYRHWDKLRRLDPPPGYSLDDWWLAIKLARAPLLRHLPLRDPSGGPFQYAVPDPAMEMLHEIDSHTRGEIALHEQVMNPSTRDYYLVNSLIEESITSSQLEGASTTRKVAKEMLRNRRPPRDRSERMIANNFAAMNFARDHAREPLSSSLIFELHRVVTEGALDQPDAAGRIRLPAEDIRVTDGDGNVLHVPPPAESLAERIEALCRFANGTTPFVHPVIRSILVHFWLAYDHPFVDGNGRTARALFYWSMLKHGYWLTEFLSISRIIRKAPARYARSFLYAETDDNDATYFVLSQMLVVKQAIADLHAYLARKVREVQATEARLREHGAADLNAREIALTTHAIKHADVRYTIEGHAGSHGVSYMTGRADLHHLERLGFLLRSKVGKTYYFRPVPDLAERLKAVR